MYVCVCVSTLINRTHKAYCLAKNTNASRFNSLGIINCWRLIKHSNK